MVKSLLEWSLMEVRSVIHFLIAEGLPYHIADRLFKNLNHPGTGKFKPTTVTCALLNLKINIKSPNYFYEIKFLENTKAPSDA
jgi:hypothetical protein